MPKRVVLMPVLWAILLGLYSPVHELGHWLVAYLDGAEILGFHPFPRWENGPANPSTVINEFSFSSINLLILFKLAGFLITLVPAVLLFSYFYLRNSDWWTLPFTWIMASPAASGHDFLDIGRNLQNYVLGVGIYWFSYVMTIGLFIWFSKSYLSRLRSITK